MPTNRGLGSIFRDTIRRFRFQDVNTLTQSESSESSNNRLHTAQPDVSSQDESVNQGPNVLKRSAASGMIDVDESKAQDSLRVSVGAAEERPNKQARVGKGSIDENSIREEDSYKEPAANTDVCFTHGEPRIVSAFDGEQEFAALLLTKQMVKMIKDMGPQSRLIKKMEGKLTNLKIEYLTLQMAIDEEEEKLVSDEIPLEQQAEVRAHTDEIKVKMDKVQSKIDGTESKLESERSVLKWWHQSIVYDVDFAMKDAELYKPEEEEAREEEEGDQERPSSVHEDEAQSAKASTESVVSIEELARRNARDDLHFWRGTLINVRQRFEEREAYCEEEWAKYQQRLEDVSMTQTDFDNKIVIDIGTMTKQLIEVEQNVEAAEFAVHELGAVSAVNDFDQESNFYDHPDDGYRESFEAWMSQSAPTYRIEPWLDRLLEEFPVVNGEFQFVEPPPVDTEKEDGEPDWDVRSVGFASSIGAMADGSNRRKIDRWREMNGLYGPR